MDHVDIANAVVNVFRVAGVGATDVSTYSVF
jgi:hypothetical protein